MVRSYGIVILWIVIYCCFGQQEPQYSLYQFNPTLINPAYAGFKEMGSINLAYRNQWVGFDGAPRTLMASVNAPFLNQKMGAGINFIADKAGARDFNVLAANLCYNLKLSSKLTFGIGFAPNFQFFQFRYDKLEFKNNEAALAALNNINISKFNMGIGLLLRSKTFFFGYGSFNLIDRNVFEQTITLPQSSGINSIIVKYRMRNHTYITLGKSFEINENLIFSPTLLLRNSNHISNLDLNLNFFLKKVIWFGLIYRHPFGPGFLVQYYAGQRFKIGYAFDTGLAQKVRLNSHEICLTYDLYKIKTNFISPRFF
ncbi:MAG: PorP/SprF family type IX secretion system membrane protein [Bacteroidia bacterium]|nr:PorP/SprF family type IX secretion system membrane protein [Bacteroidia bacterium]